MKYVKRLWRFAGVLALGLLAAVAVAACGGSSSTNTSAKASSGPVKLKFFSLANSESIEASWGEIIKAFEQRNPQISIERTPVAYGASGASYRTKAKLAAASSSPPDLIEGDPGPGGVISSLVADRLALPLEKYVSQYGWEQKIGSFISQQRLSANGKEVGNGPVYAIPTFAEVLGVFYNKALLSKTGAALPKTIAEFESTLKQAKSKGITPIMLGGLDQFPWSHFYDVLSDRYGNPQELIKWFRGTKGTTVETPRMEEAAKKLQAWVSAGYFEPGANGVSDVDAAKRFAAGHALYRVSGPWFAEEAVKGLGSNAGFFLMPPTSAGSAPASTGLMGWSVGIASKSSNQEAAAKFLDFLTGEEVRQIMLKHYNPPGTPGTSYGPGTQPIVRTMGEEFNELIKAESLVPFMDVAYPQVSPYNLLANSQSMASGKLSASEYLKTTQKGWLEFHGF